MSVYVLDTSALLAYIENEGEPVDENDIAAVGAIKAAHALSFADCCIAGLAKEKNAILIHKDPEFEKVEHEISQHKLPYKTKNP